MGDKTNLAIFAYKKHYGHPGDGFWLFLTHRTSSKSVKLHSSVTMQLLIDKEGEILYILYQYYK